MRPGRSEVQAWRPQSGVNGFELLLAWVMFAVALMLATRLIAGQAHTVQRVQTIGQGTVERVMSLVLLGDLVSLYLAVLQGIDPTPVAVIEDLKSELAQR